MKYLIFLFFLLNTVEARVDFIHIRKCGGTTIHSLLEKFFPAGEIYHYRSLKKFLESENESEKKIAHEFISGHFPFWFFKKYDDQFANSFKFTLLRSPVDRVLSEYKYRTHHGIMEGNILDIPSNEICKMLCSDPSLDGNDLLEDCKKNLALLDLILFCEEMDLGIQQLFTSLGLPLIEKKIGKLNEMATKEIFSQQTLDEIANRNALDIELYNYAVKNFKNKQGLYHPISPSFLTSLYEDKTEIFFTFDRPSLQTGWFHRENVGTPFPVYQWVRGEKGSIYFKLKKETDYQIVFHALCLAPSIMPRLEINGTSIDLQKVDDQEFSTYISIIPATLISEDLTEVSFSHPFSIRYNELHPESKDNRFLSIAVNSIHITRHHY